MTDPTLTWRGCYEDIPLALISSHLNPTPSKFALASLFCSVSAKSTFLAPLQSRPTARIARMSILSHVFCEHTMTVEILHHEVAHSASLPAKMPYKGSCADEHDKASIIPHKA
jgi:hypothetical protein